MLEKDKFFGRYSGAELLTDQLLDLGLPLAVVEKEALKDHVQMCDGVRAVPLLVALTVTGGCDSGSAGFPFCVCQCVVYRSRRLFGTLSRRACSTEAARPLKFALP